jgi:hypothetical protein
VIGDFGEHYTLAVDSQSHHPGRRMGELGAKVVGSVDEVENDSLGL